LGEVTDHAAIDAGPGRHVKRGRAAWSAYFKADTTTADDLAAVMAAAETLYAKKRCR
jgi:hypothetical protein